MKQKYELLAPAGNMECLLAAFHAGADAVYLAGQSFGARAYAGNFTTEELIEALDYAHLHHKKIYLTLNTLIKEKEFCQIVPYLTPFYQAGLDGVIIQDLGLIPLLKQHFPLLELHGSTQMTVNSYRSAKWLKEQGLCRVVPSRELSLKELIQIKEEANIEVESFIHGALCYSYSGQCMFSSFLGGRSGNRGRCAGPCRLPYSIHDKNQKDKKKQQQYPLSLKDLCSLPYIYDLMDAGIDSFKIEGRMKSPEYVAGVTALYRKYMDAYLGACGNRSKLPKISKQDMDSLQKLYIRSNVQDGYLKRHNGKDMISIDSPSYKGNDEAYVKTIHDAYCLPKLQLPVKGELILKKNEPSYLQVEAQGVVVAMTGDEVQAAQNRPLAEGDVRKQMGKTGNSEFFFETLSVSMECDVFMPLKAINELRRNALLELKNQLLACYYRKLTETVFTKPVTNTSDSFVSKENTIHVQVMSLEQYQAVITKLSKQKNQNQALIVRRIYVPMDLLFLKEDLLEQILLDEKKLEIEIYFALPRIFRVKSDAYANRICTYLPKISGVLIRNLEEMQWLMECDYSGTIVSDFTVYHWNQSALHYMKQNRDEYTYPIELSMSEICDLEDRNGAFVVYGRVPMMVSANCTKKMLQSCTQNENRFGIEISDRYHKVLPIYCNCIHCYNEVYNAVVTSLHKELYRLKKNGFATFRLDFTDELTRTVVDVLSYYENELLGKENDNSFPIAEYTTGHFKEGAM